MDRALDEVIGERQEQRGGNRGNRGGHTRHQNNWPRDAPRKNGRDETTNIDDDWLHDKYDDDADSRRPARDGHRNRRSSPEPDLKDQGAKLKVENLHYDLTEEDLEDLFNRIGPVTSLNLKYDRAGRSVGIAFVTYSTASHARAAVREFDGANANGQPIRLALVTTPASRLSRNPFDTAVKPSRSLFDRIEVPRGNSGGRRDRSRSRSPRRSDVRKPPPEGVDRYVPGARLSRSRSPSRRGRGESGRRDGGRRGGGRGRGDRDDGSRPMTNGRPRKTQEELDKEMDQYWGNKDDANGATNGATAESTQTIIDGDIDMAE